MTKRLALVLTLVFLPSVAFGQAIFNEVDSLASSGQDAFKIVNPGACLRFGDGTCQVSATSPTDAGFSGNVTISRSLTVVLDAGIGKNLTVTGTSELKGTTIIGDGSANYLQAAGSSSTPTVAAAGSSSAVGISLLGKSTGHLTFDTFFDVDSTGNIQIPHGAFLYLDGATRSTYLYSPFGTSVWSNGDFTVGGALSVNGGTVNAARFYAGAADTAKLAGNPTEGAGAVGAISGSQTALTTTGAKVHAFENNIGGTNTVVAFIDKDGSPGFGGSSGGAVTFGSFVLQSPVGLAMSASTSYDGFQAAGSVANLKAREVTCTILQTAGAGSAATLAIYDVTAAATLCSASFACATAVGTAVNVMDCNSSLTASHSYALNLTTGCGVTQPTELKCSVELAH